MWVFFKFQFTDFSEKLKDMSGYDLKHRAGVYRGGKLKVYELRTMLNIIIAFWHCVTVTVRGQQARTLETSLGALCNPLDDNLFPFVWNLFETIRNDIFFLEKENFVTSSPIAIVCALDNKCSQTLGGSFVEGQGTDIFLLPSSLEYARLSTRSNHDDWVTCTYF